MGLGLGRGFATLATIAAFVATVLIYDRHSPKARVIPAYRQPVIGERL
jgi:hypothetical protein